MLRLAFLLLLAGTGFAGAQPADPDLPPPDPPGVWRKITHDDATSDSKCIGHPVTPLCALETYLACVQRSRNDYCDMVEAGVRFDPKVRQPPANWQEYRIVYARRPSQLDPVNRATEGPLKPLSGDVIIAVYRRNCYSETRPGIPSCSIDVEDRPSMSTCCANRAIAGPVRITFVSASDVPDPAAVC